MSWGNTDAGGGDQWGAGHGATDGFHDANFGDNDQFKGGTTSFDNGGGGGFGDGDIEGGGGRLNGACFNCGEEGHMKADCPKPRVMRCRHCNAEGHTMARCPDPSCPPQEPREFTGECRVCGKEGHRAADCPDKPPMICRNCEEEGHAASDCKNPRKINRDNVAEVSAEDAWAKITQGAQDKDMDDVKEGILEYCKALPELTYYELESAFRNLNIGVYIIAVEKPQMIGALTNMDLQGNLNKKYQVTYRFQSGPARAREAQYFPKGTAENLERLNDAGEPVNSGLLKCNNCDEYGHTSKSCPSDRVEKERVVVKCYNCGPTPRVDKFACKNCGQPGHKAQECPEPPNPANVDCRKCGEKGHFSRDCPQGGGGGGACHNCGQEGHRAKECSEPKKLICRNCDEEGHSSRECPKPRDYSRVKCSNCGEMGHTKVRCKQAIPNPDADEVGMNTGASFDAAEAALGEDNLGGDFGGGDAAGNWNAGATSDGGW
ncbi:hypothetical protein JX266_008666 [Neoarthrinium moseri]|nr:hypothetical protein JX266_008666 [Neoarthrinium moseri]